MRTAPRLYLPDSLASGTFIPASPEHGHYLASVLRLKDGDAVQVFNGIDGEYTALLQATGKKNWGFAIGAHTRAPVPMPPRKLLQAVIKRPRLEWLLEKATELGVTDVYPLLTDRADRTPLKTDRLSAIAIEAAEQCEALAPPDLHPLQSLSQLLQSWPASSPILWAAERMDAAPLVTAMLPDAAILIGPEGGFSPAEQEMLGAHPAVIPVSLGSRILRAETAAIMMLSVLQTTNDSEILV